MRYKFYVPEKIGFDSSEKDILVVLSYLRQFSMNLRSLLYNRFRRSLTHYGETERHTKVRSCEHF